jgi:hypothetical protein
VTAALGTAAACSAGGFAASILDGRAAVGRRRSGLIGSFAKLHLGGHEVEVIADLEDGVSPDRILAAGKSCDERVVADDAIVRGMPRATRRR